jgi:hypothetical protein
MMITTMIDDGYDGNKQQLCRQWRYKAICVQELYNNGVQNRKGKFFSSTSCVLFLFFFIPFLVELLKKATHYMIASSKTHMNAQTKC